MSGHRPGPDHLVDFFVVEAIVGYAPLPSDGGPTSNVCLTVEGEDFLALPFFVACFGRFNVGFDYFGIGPHLLPNDGFGDGVILLLGSLAESGDGRLVAFDAQQR